MSALNPLPKDAVSRARKRAHAHPLSIRLKAELGFRIHVARDLVEMLIVGGFNVDEPEHQNRLVWNLAVDTPHMADVMGRIVAAKLKSARPQS